MAVLPILTGSTNETLRTNASKAEVTKATLKLIRDMQETVKHAEGAGLAAPQIGQSLRVCLCLINKKMTPMINPEITWMSEEKKTDEEGCLSLPDIVVKVPRSVEIALRYTDEKGQEQERKLQDFDARVVQHEVDHLDGVLIVDYS